MATTKVNSEFIAVNAISGTIIADGAITSTHLAANCVDSSELVTGSIDTIHIAANQVTSAKIVSDAVLTRHIADDQVTQALIAVNSVGISELAVTDGSDGQALTTNGSGTLSFASVGVSGISSSADATAMTITSGEHVLIGKTALDNSTVGIRMNSTGDASFVANGNRALVLNRKTSDGDIAIFSKDNTTVGSIGTDATDIYIGTTDTGIRFNDAVNGVLPYNTSSGQTDNTIDLGFSSVRWKDLYLSGGVYLGGTGTANKLDDYEEGTWTPAFYTYSGVTTTSMTVTLATYTKIGNICHIHANVNATLSSLPGQTVTITGLPFAASGSDQYAIIAVGGHTANTGGNTPKAHFRTNGSQLDGVYYNASNSTAYWAYAHMDVSTFHMSIHGFYTTA